MALKKEKLYQIGFMVLLVWSVVSLFVFLGGGFLGRYLGTGFVQGMIRELGIGECEFHIRRVGLSGIDAGPVRLGSFKNPALVIRSIVADYSIGKLFQQKIDRVRLSGVTLRCKMADGGISFPGIDLQEMLKAGEETPADPSQAPLAVPVDRLEIYDGTVFFDWGNHEYRIPFDIEAHSEGENRFLVSLRLFPRDEAIDISGDIGLTGKQLRLSILSKDVLLSRFADIIEKIPGLNLKGGMDITANAECDLSPFDVVSVDADLTWKKFRLDYQNVGIKGPDVDAKGKDIFNLRLKHEKGKAWDVFSSGVSLTSPFPLIFSDVHLSLSTTDRGIFAKGDVLGQSRISTTHSSPEGGNIQPLRIPMTFSADYFQEGKWQVDLSTAPDRKDKKGYVGIPDVDVSMTLPVWNITASGEGHKAKVAWAVSLSHVNMAQGEAVISIPAVNATGTGKLNGDLFSADIRMDFKNTALKSGSMACNMPDISFSGHLAQAGGQDPLFNGIFSLSGATFADKENDLSIQGIRAMVPVAWPFEASADPGRFSADSIKVKNYFLGSADGMIRQKGRGVMFKGTHASNLLSGLTVDFSGQGRIPENDGFNGQVSLNIAEHSQVADLDLGRFSPDAEGVLFTGKLTGEGEIHVASNGIDGFFEAAVTGGRLSAEEANIEVEGIHGEVRFPELPAIESAPDQKIGFARASFGEIVLKDGEVRYKVESPESFFIEKGRLGWCNGQIETRSFRILTGIEDYEMIFYCAKLELAQVIQQITPFSAEGGGTVSGRIPLIYKNGDISFTKGFLFSEPGVTGRIRISKTEMLTEGIMAGTAKFTQLVIAQEALKNYEYNWAKLELNTEEETLFVSLRFDGKPVQPLPFFLDKKSGQLVKDDSGRSKAVFDKGISLDLNTSLPLNEILKYKDVFTNKLK